MASPRAHSHFLQHWGIDGNMCNHNQASFALIKCMAGEGEG